MAARLADVLEEMKRVLTDGSVHSLDREPKILGLAADFLVAALAGGTDTGRVAILMKQPDAEQLTFVYPKHLARGNNSIPIDRDSIAGQVVLGNKTVIENDLVKEPHRDIFELIPDEGGAVSRIQKMVAAPMVDKEGAVRGVVEVSRAGVSAQASGPDFLQRDAVNLGKCCRVFTPFIVRVWNPEKSW